MNLTSLPHKEAIARSQHWRYAVLGAAALVVLGWVVNTPPGLLGKADAIGYAVCHRIEVRSFHLGERAISLCARCTGMYLGALVALGYQMMLGRRQSGAPARGVMAVLALLFVFFAVDGVNSGLSALLGSGPLYPPNNILRLISGTGMGVVMAAAIYPAFNQTTWRKIDPQPALGTWKQLGGLLVLGALVTLLVVSENPLVLYPLALVSAAGVLVLLTMVYSMMWMMLTRTENSYARARELLAPLAGGFTLTVLQISLIDLGRFALTGTWQGFHLTLG